VTMTLEQVRDEISAHEKVAGYFTSIGTAQLFKWKEVIDAHLTQPAQAVDVAKPYAWTWLQLMHDSQGGWETKLERYNPTTRDWIRPEDIRDLRPLYTTLLTAPSVDP
jgi:hypothetical protein